MNILIPLGGIGERFQRKGFSLPKPLIKVFEKPILHYLLDRLSLEPEDRLYIFYNALLDAHHFREKMLAAYPHVHLVRIPYTTRGAAESVLYGLEACPEMAERPCVLMDGDAFYRVDILNLIRQRPTKNCVVYHRTENPNPIFSYITCDADGRILQIAEKQKISPNANTGVYAFESRTTLMTFCKKVLTEEHTAKGEFYTSCVIDRMLHEDPNTVGCFYGLEINETDVVSLGTPEQVDAFKASTHAFLFDLDGTLVISDDIYFHVWETLLKEYSIHLTPDLFDTHIRGKSDAHVVQTLLSLSVDVKALGDRKDALALAQVDRIRCVPGAETFLRSLYQQGWPIAIVTNCNRAMAEAILKKTGLAPYIYPLIVGGESLRSKPYPDPYRNAMMVLDLEPHQCWIFEDSKTGLLSGSSVQPRCLVGLETCYGRKDLMEGGAHLTYPDFRRTWKDLLADTQEMEARSTTVDLVPLVRDAYRIHTDAKIHTVEIQTEKLKGGLHFGCV